MQPVVCEAMFLDENKGTFTADDGRTINYRNARFLDVSEHKIFKATINDNSGALPELGQTCECWFEVNAGERYCKLIYSHAEE